MATLTSDNPALKWFDRRRRVRRPWTLVAFGVLFLLLPLFNYLSVAFAMQYPVWFYRLVLAAMNPVELVLLLLPLPVGVGLLLVRKWGWYLLLSYGFLLSAYNLVIFALTFSRYNFGALGMTVFGIAAIAYFVRRDVSAPYMKMYPRGWRLEKRLPIVQPVVVAGRDLQTRDISERGLYAEWADFDGAIGDELPVRFSIAGADFSLRAGVARVDEGFGVGLAFRALDPTVAGDLEQAFRVYRRERQRTSA